MNQQLSVSALTLGLRGPLVSDQGAPTKTSRVSSLVCWNLIGASFRLKLLLRDCI
jgi:hypothetical protein